MKNMINNNTNKNSLPTFLMFLLIYYFLSQFRFCFSKFHSIFLFCSVWTCNFFNEQFYFFLGNIRIIYEHNKWMYGLRFCSRRIQFFLYFLIFCFLTSFLCFFFVCLIFGSWDTVGYSFLFIQSFVKWNVLLFWYEN